MLQGVHERKISQVVLANHVGDNIVVPGQNDRWLYIHELIGAPNVDGTLSIRAGSRELARFALKANQGLTEQDEPGEDNRPRFECKPGENFILNCSAGMTFEGSVHYSWGF